MGQARDSLSQIGVDCQVAEMQDSAGDPSCLPPICSAKRIYRKIVQATDSMDGGSDLNGGLGAVDNEEDVDGKREYGKEQGKDDGSIIDPVNIFADSSDTPTTAASTSIETSQGKQFSAPKWSGGGNQRRERDSSSRCVILGGP